MRNKPTWSLLSLFVVMVALLVASAPAAARSLAPPAARAIPSNSAAPYLYVANYEGWTVTEYAKNASGDAAPVASIEGDQTGLKKPGGLTLSPTGRLFVTNYGDDSVTEYASGAAGNVAPVATIKGARTGLSRPEGIAMDAAGDLFVTNYGDASVTEYASGAVGDVAPIAVLKGDGTALNTPVGVVLTPTGTMYVGNSARGAVAEYAKGATGNAAPITEYDNGLRNPEGLALTAQGDVLVADRGGSGSAVETLAPGNPNPVATIMGRLTELNGPIGVAVVPPAPPGSPVIGTATAGDGSAAVAFTPPGLSGSSPITSYTATATDLTDSARGGQTATGQGSPIMVKGLTNGDSYRLSVRATNTVGTGPASSPSNVVVPRANFYVANAGNDSLTEYTAGGTVPIVTIEGPHTQLRYPDSVVLGPTGNLFVANRGNTVNSSVTEYASGATGDAAPIATIKGPHTDLLLAAAVALGPAGDIFVANRYSVTEYASGATGDVAPVARIIGSGTGLNDPDGLALDPAGKLLVANYDGNSITAYAKGATGNAAPIATIIGADTALNGPDGLALDPAGDVFIANYAGDSVTKYAKGATGNAAPVATIAGGNTGLQHPAGVSLDRSGNLFVANASSSSVTAYAEGATGNTAPFAMVSGPATELDAPLGVAVSTASVGQSPPPSPSNGLGVSRIRSSRTGTVSFRIKVPGPGVIDVLETASNDAITRAVDSRTPAPQRFVYARKHLRTSSAGTKAVSVDPNLRGRRLLALHRGSFAIRLSIAYRPDGGTRRTTGPYRVLISRSRTPVGRG